jgi:hypothetical protein
MNLIKFLAKVLLHLLKVLTYQWALDGADLFKRLLATLKKLCAYLKLPHADQESSGKDPCKVDHPSLHRPDPCIYSQPGTIPTSCCAGTASS